MRYRWTWARWLSAAAVAGLLVSVGSAGRGTAATPEEGAPSSELILLLSGEIEGNLEPCG